MQIPSVDELGSELLLKDNHASLSLSIAKLFDYEEQDFVTTYLAIICTSWWLYQNTKLRLNHFTNIQAPMIGHSINILHSHWLKVMQVP